MATGPAARQPRKRPPDDLKVAEEYDPSSATRAYRAPAELPRRSSLRRLPPLPLCPDSGTLHDSSVTIRLWANGTKRQPTRNAPHARVSGHRQRRSSDYRPEPEFSSVFIFVRHEAASPRTMSSGSTQPFGRALFQFHSTTQELGAAQDCQKSKRHVTGDISGHEGTY